jgi:hypothetical protein
LSILIGPSGSSRLSNPTKPDLSASNPEIEEILELSEGSSSEVNSPVGLEKVSIAEGDKSQEIFESEEKVYQLHSNAKDFAIKSSGVSEVHQLCIIITEVEEGNNNKGSKEVDKQVDKRKDTKQEPSASEPEATATMECSDGSSSEVNSSVSSEEVRERKMVEGNNGKNSLNAEIQLDDLMIRLDDISDNSEETWKTGLELSEDGDSIFSSSNSNIGRKHQVFAIVGDNSEEIDENNNPVINPANVDRGANHLAEGETVESLAGREKIRLSANEWKTIREAVQHGTPILSNSSKDMLFGYHYALRQQAKQLAREKSEVQRRKDSAIAASEAARRARSDASYSNARRNLRHGSRYDNLEHSDRQSILKNLDSSFLSVDEQGNILPKTPEAALVAAQAYLLTTKPSPGDPREHMHRAALNGLSMVGHRLLAKGEEPHHDKEVHRARSPRRHNSPRHKSSKHRSRSPSPKQHGGSRRSRSPNERCDYEDDEKEMGGIMLHP